MQHIYTTMFFDHGWEPTPIGLGKILQIGVRKKNLQLWTVSSHEQSTKNILGGTPRAERDIS